MTSSTASAADTPAETAAPETAARRAMLAALAAAEIETLDAAWAALAPQPAWRWLRRPETGLVMVRGRAGGSGAPFNLGEVPVTRCAVALDDGVAGFGWVMGRVPRKAWLVAVFAVRTTSTAPVGFDAPADT